VRGARHVQERIDIVVPVYNEQASIDEFYERVARLGLASHLLFVDNASTDGTVAAIERHPDVRLIRHATNEGYGASIRDGITASEAEYIVVIDADLEYPPESIPALLQALEAHPVVFGSRFLGPQPPAMSLLRRLGNRWASGLFNVLFGQRTTDLYTGMKGLRRSRVPLSLLRCDGFEHCVELAAVIARAGHRIHEIPVEYRPRQKGRSKMRHVREGLKLTTHMIGQWLRQPIGGATSLRDSRDRPAG